MSMRFAKGEARLMETYWTNFPRMEQSSLLMTKYKRKRSQNFLNLTKKGLNNRIKSDMLKYTDAIKENRQQKTLNTY